jgi:hypothetical protein
VFRKLKPKEVQTLLDFIWQDPFRGLYQIALIGYAIILVIILFWHFNFKFIGKKNQVQWIDAFPGVELVGEGQVISHSFSKPLYDSLVKGKGL